MTEPHRSVEIERKFDVQSDTPVPDWTSLRAVASVDPPETRHLDARYFDTVDAALAAQRVALRRREGGPDAGWHIKTHLAAAHGELRWPLGAGPADRVPDDVGRTLMQWAAGPYLPLARIRNRRMAYLLRDDTGRPVAEFVDDHVDARDERRGVTAAWREWEVELAESAPADIDAFFADVGRLVAAVGGRPAASDSKLARALGR